MYNFKVVNLGAIFALACSVGIADAKSIDPERCTTPIRTGKASWYGEEMAVGRKHGKPVFNDTASGEAFSPDIVSAAHKTLPLGTYVKAVTEDDRELVVKINDRGPYKKGRIIDFSEKAAELLHFRAKGETTVTLYKCKP